MVYSGRPSTTSPGFTGASVSSKFCEVSGFLFCEIEYKRELPTISAPEVHHLVFEEDEDDEDEDDEDEDDPDEKNERDDASHALFGFVRDKDVATIARPPSVLCSR